MHNEDPWINDVKPPAECTCTRLVVDTLDETLDCPEGWRYAPWAEAWIHDGPI